MAKKKQQYNSIESYFCELLGSELLCKASQYLRIARYMHSAISILQIKPSSYIVRYDIIVQLICKCIHRGLLLPYTRLSGIQNITSASIAQSAQSAKCTIPVPNALTR